MCRQNRRIGLGVMGFADLLYQLNVGYATPEGRAIAEQTMQVIGEAASEMSCELGKAKGVFPAWDKVLIAQSLK